MTMLICGWDEGLVRRLLARQADIVLVIDEEERTSPAVEELRHQLRRLHVLSSLEQLSELATVGVAEQLAETRCEVTVGATEPSQLAAGYLAGVLTGDLTQLNRSLLLRDKRAMKERVRAAGVRVARQLTLEPGLPLTEWLDRMERELGWPVVVKPVAGTASTHTAVLTSRPQAQTYLTEQGFAGTLMAEEYLTGDELHIDAVWQDGEPRILGVSRYLVPRVQIHDCGRNNGSALLPEPDHRQLYRDVERLHRQVNQALGIDTAITHLELFVGPDGTLWFSEVAGRVGGGGVNRVFETSGIDLRELFADLLCDRPVPATVGYPQRLIGWVNLAPERPGRIDTMPDRQALAEPYVLKVQSLLSDGEETGPLTASSWVCLAVFEADSWPQYLERARILESKRGELLTTS